MEPNDQGQGGNPTPQQQQPGDVPASEGQSQLEELQRQLDLERRRYSGLQGNFQQLQTQRSELEQRISELESQNQQYIQQTEGERATANQQVTQLQTEREKLQEELDALKSEHASLSQFKQLSSVIANDYPELSGLHAKGLLRTDGLEGDDLTNYLDAIRGEFASTSQRAVEIHRKGATPERPVPAGDQSIDLDNQRQKLLKGVLQPGSKEYKEAYTRYLEEITKG